MGFLGSLLSAGSSLLGGILGQQNQSAINQQNIAMQEEFAQNGIQWKVADAKKAGINPLAALGAQTSSFSDVVGSNDLASGVSAAGQDVGRAIAATQSADDRRYTEAQKAQQLQKGDLENQYLASQIRKLNQVGPPMPAPDQKYIVPGQGPAVVGGTSAQGQVQVVPDKVTAMSEGDPTLTAGAHPDMQFVRVGSSWMPMPSKDFQGASFGSNVSSDMWDMRNVYLPTLGFNQHPPSAPPPGFHWSFNPWTGYSLSKDWKRPESDKWYNFFSSPAY